MLCQSCLQQPTESLAKMPHVNSRVKILEGCLQAKTASPYSGFSEKYEAVRVNLPLLSCDSPSVQTPTHTYTHLLTSLSQPGPSYTTQSPLCFFEQHTPQEILEPLITHRCITVSHLSLPTSGDKKEISHPSEPSSSFAL